MATDYREYEKKGKENEIYKLKIKREYNNLLKKKQIHAYRKGQENAKNKLSEHKKRSSDTFKKIYEKAKIFRDRNAMKKKEIIYLKKENQQNVEVIEKQKLALNHLKELEKSKENEIHLLKKKHSEEIEKYLEIIQNQKIILKELKKSKKELLKIKNPDKKLTKKRSRIEEEEEEEGEDEYFSSGQPHPDNFPSPSQKSRNNREQRVFKIHFTQENFSVATSNFRKKSNMYEKIEEIVRKVDYNSRPQTLEELLNKRIFRKRISSEELKVRAIYSWIVRNYRYDKDWKKKYNNIKDYQPYLAMDVYRSSGKTICGGFANLFYELCKLSGIGVRVISGYIKKITDIPGESVTSNSIGHAWNIVRIDGRWFIVDCSHARNSSEDENGYYSLNEFFFLTDPKEFIFDHWSKDYQFLEYPLTQKEWENLVLIDLSKHKIKSLSQKNAVVVLKNGNNWKLSFKFEKKSKKSKMFVVHKVQREQDLSEKELERMYAYSEIIDGNVSIFFSFPFGRTSYIVTIGIGSGEISTVNSSYSYSSSIKYRVIIESDEIHYKRFCYPTRVSPKALQNNCQIIEGKEIIWGKENLFRLKLPECLGCFIELVRKGDEKGEQISLVEVENQLFVGNIMVDVEKLNIYGKWSLSRNNTFSEFYSFQKFL